MYWRYYLCISFQELIMQFVVVFCCCFSSSLYFLLYAFRFSITAYANDFKRNVPIYDMYQYHQNTFSLFFSCFDVTNEFNNFIVLSKTWILQLVFWGDWWFWKEKKKGERERLKVRRLNSNFSIEHAVLSHSCRRSESSQGDQALVSNISCTLIGCLSILRNVSMHTGKPQAKAFHAEATHPARAELSLAGVGWGVLAWAHFPLHCSIVEEVWGTRSLESENLQLGTTAERLDSGEFPCSWAPVWSVSIHLCWLPVCNFQGLPHSICKPCCMLQRNNVWKMVSVFLWQRTRFETRFFLHVRKSKKKFPSRFLIAS